ncbi:ABC transporter ATP-binding protein [Camelimonas abortus]|uniref:ABC transporter ATP-binding protein n=1 Tax=Camelimonas abortus TaxID=1017184 RepID=A0ABV7LGQ5_9HYPH
MSNSILEVRDVDKVFGGVRALSDLSISIAEGEVHCVVGPNGAGKSTFFKILIGVERPTRGQVFFRGRDVTRLKAFERARLGLSVKFQNISAFGDLTAAQNLFVPLRRNHPKAEIRERASAILRRIGLPGVEDVPVKRLSHGQQQWLSIGLAIAAEPELLLLDEPAAGLSAEETARTAGLIRELNRSGMTVVVIEHDMGFIRSLNARTSVLHYGSLFAQGSFDEIAANEDVRRIYLGAE